MAPDTRTPVPDGHESRSPAPWEKALGAAVAVSIFLLVGWLAVRNEPFADPNLVVLLRIVLSVAAGILGAMIPGFLGLAWSGRGLAVRAGGALALVILSLVWSPAVIQAPTPAQAEPFPPGLTNSPTATVSSANHAVLTGGVHLAVPARPRDWRVDVLTPTSVHVARGNSVSLTASGHWSVGAGEVGPGGKEDWCECVVSEAVGAGFRGNLGALIGRIGQRGSPFVIGTAARIKAQEDGTLFMGANDNLGPCDGTTRGSCYRDNAGTLDVEVVVREEEFNAVVASTAGPPMQAGHCARLNGRTGVQSGFGAGWLDLDPPADFDVGTRLSIKVGGTASNILVRLLPQGSNPNTPIGILEPSPVAVPPRDRVVNVTLQAHQVEIRQISVHGSPTAFERSLGQGNGPATLEYVDACPGRDLGAVHRRPSPGPARRHLRSASRNR